MSFSDWQLGRVRNALAAFHAYADHEGRRYNWKDVVEAIALNAEFEISLGPNGDDTKVRLASERLRQFVEGIPDKKTGGRRFPVPADPEWLAAIIKFVTDEDQNLLRPNEMQEYAPAEQAPLRLLEYLDQDFDGERMPPPAKLEGRYETSLPRDNTFSVISLEMQTPQKSGLIKVAVVTDHFSVEAGAEFKNWNPAQRIERRRSQEQHWGWAVFTPEDNLVMILKDYRGRNKYYVSLAYEDTLWDDEPLNRLAFLHHDYPFELDEGDLAKPDDELTTAITNEMRQQVWLFHKTA